jgi:hypothetical protein
MAILILSLVLSICGLTYPLWSKLIKKEAQKSDKDTKSKELDKIKNIEKTAKEDPIIDEVRTIKGQITEAEKHLKDIQQQQAQNEKTTADNKLSQNKKDIEQNSKAITIATEKFNTNKEK